MKITVMGSGYVGLVTATCLANAGHQVVCFDIDAERIARLRQGICPVFEPGLEDCIAQAQRAGVLEFECDPQAAFRQAQVIFIAVGTPPGEDGSADICHVLSAATMVGRQLQQRTLVVTKSTVPVGTAEQVHERIAGVLAERRAGVEFEVASNPEFLKEGSAVDDFMKPDRIVIGTRSAWAEKLLRTLYAPFNRNRERIMVMDVRSAELTKYAANAMLAAKISFINEIANIAEILGADIEQVRQGIGADPRIGYHFIYPGCGYGGSCFPKDVRALEASALHSGYRPQLLRAVREVNERQKQRLADKMLAYYGGELRGRTFAVWGLSFKPRTDDMREAPSRVLLETLWQAGARVRAFDPRAMDQCQALYGERDDLLLLGTKETAAKDADALIICTEWKGFWAPDFEALRAALRAPVIFDGRNLYDPDQLAELGFEYMGIGRGLDPAAAGVRARCGRPVRAA